MADNAFNVDLSRAERTAHVVGRPVPILKRVERPPFTWEDAVPGSVLPALEYCCDSVSVAFHAGLLDAIAPTGAGHETGHVPPSFFSDEPMQCLNARYAQSGRLHAGHRIEVFEKVPVDAQVRVQCRVANRFEKGPRRFVELAAEVLVKHAATSSLALRVTAVLLL